MKARIPNAGNSGNMMKQIQKMQEEMARVQEARAAERSRGRLTASMRWSRST